MRKVDGLGRAQRKTRFAVLIALLSHSSVAVAADTLRLSETDRAERRANAEALFDEAKALMAAHRPAEACPKFAESQAIDPAVGTSLNLAVCLEKIGRTASAWAEFRAAAAAARAKRQTERERIARSRAAALESVLVRLVIVPPLAPESGLVIKKNGVAVGRASWGIALPVDPGRSVIEASAPGKQSFRTDVDVPDKPGTEVTVTIPALEQAKTSGRAQRIAGVAVGGIGVASTIAGALLGAQAISQNAASSAHCIGGNLCDRTGVTLRSEARTRGNASTAAFAMGAIAGAAGIVIYVTAPKEPATNVGLGVVGSGVGVFVGGAF